MARAAHRLARTCLVPACCLLLFQPLAGLAASLPTPETVVPCPGTASAQNPALSPDGATLVYTLFHQGYNQGPAAIMSRSLAHGEEHPLLDEADTDSVNLPGSAWNPATGRIAFSSDREGPDEIWTMDGNGGGLFRVTRHSEPGYYIEPSFSPDGQWIVFEADQDLPDDLQQGSIGLVRADGTGLTWLTRGPALGTDDRQPNWSPAGDRILFQRRLPGAEDWDIYTMRPDGTDLRQVTTSPSSDTDASFSPDGAWIVFSSDHGGLPMPNIFLVPAAGGAPVQASSSATDEHGAPSISPDGCWIFFESHPGQDEETPAGIMRIPAPAFLHTRTIIPCLGPLFSSS